MNEHHEHEHTQSPDFTIELNVNVRFPGLTAVLVPALAAIFQPQLHRIERLIMITAEQVTALETSNAALLAEVKTSNDKQDALILVASQTKDALVALQADADPTIAARIQAIIDSQTTAVADIKAQEAETDAAAAADAP